MLEIIIVTIILVVLFELFLRVIFKISMFITGNRDFYVYVVGAILLALIVIFVRPLLNISPRIFYYGVFFYILLVATFAVVPSQRVKDSKSRFVLNIFSLVISCLLVFLAIKVIANLIA